jgi:hypothetical protein
MFLYISNNLAQEMECSVVVNKYIYCIFRNTIPGSHDSTHLSRLESVLYINVGAPTGKYILQYCIGLVNIPEPLGLLLAGETVEELDWI